MAVRGDAAPRENRARTTATSVTSMSADRIRIGTVSLVACEIVAAAGAPITSPVAHARLSIIDANASAIPARSAESVITAIDGIV